MGSGSPISFKDLFDFTKNEDIRGAITDVEKLTEVYQDFRTTVTGGMMEKLAQQQSELAQTVRDLVAANKELNVTNKVSQKAIIDATSEIKRLDEEKKKLLQTTNAVRTAEELALDSVDGLRKKLSDLTKEYNKLSQSEKEFDVKQKELADDINVTRKEINDLTSVIRVNVTTFKAATNSYDELDRETKQLVRDLKSLGDGMDKNSKKANLLKKQIYDNTRRLKEFDREMNQNFRNVGNYSSAFGGLTRQIGSYVAGLVAISTITRGIGYAFERSIKFDAISRSLGFVSESTIEAEKNMLFLRRTAQELGLDFETLTKAYTRFTAATRGTNLQGEVSRKIFLSVAKASAVMKLSVEETEGVFLALEQIISKGKLQAEELRKQLGNRLPGAFQLFAKGLNLTTAELDSFLKKGQITKDSLVPFAEELEKSFGPGLAENVGAVQSQVNRLNDSIKELFQGKTLAGFFGSIASAANDLVRAMFDLDGASFRLAISQKREAIEAQSLVNEYETLLEKTSKNADEKQRLETIVTSLSAQFGNSVTQINEETGALELNLKATKDLITQKLLLSNDEASKAAAKYKRALDQEKEGLEQVAKGIKLLTNAEADLGRPASELLLLRSGTGLRNTNPTDLSLFTKQEQVVLKLSDAYTQSQRKIKDAREEIKKYGTQLEALGFTIEDVDKLLNPEGGNPTIDPFGGDTSEQEAKKAEAARKRKIKSAEDLIKANQKLRTLELEGQFANDEQSISNKLLFEDKKQKIVEDSIRAQQLLYKEGSTEYIKLESELVKATNSRAEGINDINEEASKNFRKNYQKRFDDIKKITEAYFEYERSLIEAKADSDIGAVLLNRAGSRNSENADAKADFQIFEIRKQLLNSDIQATKDALSQKEDADEEYYRFKLQLSELERRLATETANFQIAQAERVGRAKQAVENAAYDFFTQASNSYFEIQSANIDNEMAQLEKRYEYEKELAGTNKTALTTIDRRYQADRKKMLKERSEQEKEAAVFRATINAVAGIVRAFADYAFPYSAIVAGLAGAAAFVEVATIEKTSVPQYWKGRTNGPAETAMVNEKGFELIKSKGKYHIAGGGDPTLTYLNSGDKVLTHEQSIAEIASSYQDGKDVDNYLDTLLNGIGVHVQKDNIQSDNIIRAISGNALDEKRLSKHIADAISSLPLNTFSWDERGFNKHTTIKKQRITELSERNKLGGKG